MKYVELILPLDLKENYHYLIREDMYDEELEASDLVGRRVSVSFGTKRFYTAIIRRITSSLPLGIEAKYIKEVESIIDLKPILSEEDLCYWEWLAEYYQCSIGQVMRSALPKGLIPESKTIVRLNEDFIASQRLSKLEESILDSLSQEKKGLAISILRSRLGRGSSAALDRLLSMGAIFTEETIQSRYKVKSKPYIRLSEGFTNHEALTELFEGTLKRAKKQQDLVLDFLDQIRQEQGEDISDYSTFSIDKAKLCKGQTARTTLLRSLVNRGVFVEFKQAVSRLQQEKAYPISEEYQKKLEAYKDYDLKEGVHYLYTGNSRHKEELFIAQIQKTLQAGGQVLLLSPQSYSSEDRDDFYNKLRSCIKEKIFFYNNLTSEAKRCELVLKLKQEQEPCIIIGGRNAIFLPLANLQLIIIDEEQEYLYKQQFAQPLYHSRDVALYLAHKQKIPILLASETPSAESLFNILRGKYQLLETNEQLQEKPELKLKIETIDLRQQKKEGKLPYGHSISLVLKEAIEQNISAGKRVLILQNRKGYAPYIICNSCSERIVCKRCDVALNYHASSRNLQCHYCGYTQSLPQACPSCNTRTIDFYGKQQSALALIGYGTERVEEELQKLFPKAKILRIDSDSLQSNKRQQEVLEKLQSDDIDIIVGTQLIKSQALQGNRQLGLMAVLQLDELLAYPDFRTEERAYQLLYQLLMRYSEGLEQEGEAKLIIQTNKPEQDFIQKLRAFDYRSFIKEQLSERQLLNFPPFCRISYIKIKGFAEQEVEETANLLSKLLKKHWQDFGRVSDAQKPSIARIDNQYIRQITCKRPFQEPYRNERQVFSAVLEELATLYPSSKRVRVLFDIDPL